jgi:hypothetical protein
MIRRDAGDAWLLIAQPAHARFAGELAARWVADAVAPREAVLFAIAHHDDGWIEWERAPRADPETGVPVDFRGIRADEFVTIWRRGPRLAAAHDPLAGVLVSRHGSYLAELNLASRPPEDRAPLEEFLRGQEALRAALLGGRPGDAALERNVRLLRDLDYLSLALCMAPAAEREIGPLRLAPLGERAVAVAPWPFSGDEVRGEVEARRIAKARYDDRELARAIAAAAPERLDFRLRRG